jgi:hypothetical protein
MERDVMQNSLPRLFAGITDALRDVILPAVGDDYARAQLTACIEVLANVATRVEWRADQLWAVRQRADTAIADAAAAAPGLADAVGPPAPTDDAVVARDDALARVSAALRWCDAHDADDAVAPLVAFAVWQLESELALLRTGMFRP